MISVWSAHAELPRFETMSGDQATDVLIIGGGMAGLLCAYFLQQQGADYLLVEGSRILGGVTKNTTAKITSQHGLIYDKLLRGVGPEKAQMYLRVNEAAVHKFRELCQGIDCGFEDKDAYVYSLDDRSVIEDELTALSELNYPEAEFVQKLPLPFPVQGAIRFKNQAQFHPLQFGGAIAKGLRIYENTFVTGFAGMTAMTTQGKIRAKRIVFATHFPILNKHGAYFMKMYQHRSYVIALENAPDVHGMYLDEAQKGMSFRNYQGYLLVGGGDHRTGKKGGGWKELRDFASRHYPNATERYHWATQDCMTLDSAPYIGAYSEGTEGLFVATGFNKWGMTSAMVSAMVLSDMLAGKKNKFSAVFYPSRSMLKPQLFLNALEATAGLLTFSSKRCPHLGCALKWNALERTWDCPCHGSRFEANGRLIDNPATGNLKED